MRLQVRLRACHGLGLAFSTQGPLKSFGTSCWSFHHLCALAAQPCLTLPCRAWEKVQVQSFGISHTRNQRKWVTAFHRKWYEFPVPSSMMWSQACSASCCWIILCQSMCVWVGGTPQKKPEVFHHTISRGDLRNPERYYYCKKYRKCNGILLCVTDI